MLATSWRCVLLGVVLATAGAQQRISLAGDRRPKNALQRHVLELSMADKKLAAMSALWAIGPAAVPLLAAEVERNGATAAAALDVLERLGGEATPAVPVLQRALRQATGSWRTRLQAVVALLDGPPCILVPRHNDNEIVQLDFDGNVQRRIACNNPWAVWPLPDDHVGAIDFANGRMLELTWQGETIASQVVHESLTACRWFDNGDRLTTSWRKEGILARLAPDGSAVWEASVGAIRLDLLWQEHAFVITREEPRLQSYTAAGELATSLKLPCECYGMRLLPGGNVLLAAPDGKVLEMDQAGKVVLEQTVECKPNDAVRLPDGRTLVDGADDVLLLGKDGVQVWRCSLGYCGPMFVRAPSRQ